uniref:Natural killer cells antigen CD94 n=1 Tax=Loxodonta africana TaxID=9785 RepID=G3TQG4_LOXAF
FPVFQTTPWRLISGILGVICLLLMAILGIFLNNCSWLHLNLHQIFSPGLIIELQGDSDCCSCPEKWIGYRCSCYLIFNAEKTWAESRNFCASQNSSLLQLKSRDELDFLNYRRQFYWLGISYNETHGTWLWEDGSAPSQDLFSFFQTLDPKKCIVHSPNKEILDEPCGGKRPYICEQQLI